MTPRQLANDAEQAYYARDRDSLHRALGQLAAMASPPDLSRLTREQLDQRRSDLRTQLADINDRLAAMQAAGRQTQALADLLRPSPPDLEPSD